MTKVRHRAKVCLTGFAHKNNNLSRGVTDKTDKTPIFRILFRDAYARPLQCAGGLYCKKSYKCHSPSQAVLSLRHKGFFDFLGPSQKPLSPSQSVTSFAFRHRCQGLRPGSGIACLMI
jgi:hypothetical protein